LSSQTPGDAQTNSEGAANGVRLHSVYDGSSEPDCAASDVYCRRRVAVGR
jgi:hypothetical protein